LRDFVNDQIKYLISYNNKVYSEGVSAQREIYENLLSVDTTRSINSNIYSKHSNAQSNPTITIINSTTPINLAPGTININQLVDETTDIDNEES
jgi:hypothetical protein